MDFAVCDVWCCLIPLDKNPSAVMVRLALYMRVRLTLQ
jgi:hypothetical protein